MTQIPHSADCFYNEEPMPQNCDCGAIQRVAVAPVRITSLEKTESQRRKEQPMYRGLLKYFPRALAAIAGHSFIANEKHNPGEELHWAREKSTDHEDCILRHLADRARGETFDSDGLRHATSTAWRALAVLEIELEKAEEKK